MTEPDLRQLLADRKPTQGVHLSSLPPDVAEKRRKEVGYRMSRIESLAVQGLKRLHPEDWKALQRQARAMVEADRGPLPGDPS